MSDAKAETTVQPTAYAGTVKVNIRDRDFFVHITPPAPGSSLEELEKALERNRELLVDCQTAFKKAFSDQLTLPPLKAKFIDFDSHTQNAIMAHLNTCILIPLINMRGGTAIFAKPETMHVKARIELMLNMGETTAKRELYIPMPHPITRSFSTAMLIVSAAVIAMMLLLR